MTPASRALGRPAPRGAADPAPATAAPAVAQPGSRPPRTAEPPFRTDIQGLRGMSVSLVVLAHAGLPWIAGGYVGVDVFFVISGFLITSGLLHEADRTGTVSLRRFYARRALRILPLATLVLLATLAGCLLFASKIRHAEFTQDALASAAYVMNIDLAVTGTDYLRETQAPSPFQHYWSLSVEEQFYLLWPLLLLIAVKTARRPLLRALPLALLCAGSFLLAVRTTPGAPSWGYFGPHTRLWELGCGGLLAFCAGALTRLPRLAAAACTWLGSAAVLASAVLYDDRTPFPGTHALLPVLGAVLVIGGGCHPTRSVPSRLLALRPAAWLGDVSYGWYLWHWPLLMIGPGALGREATPLLSLQLSALALLLAWLSLHLVEKPLRGLTPLRRRPLAAVFSGLGLSATVVCAALVAASFPPAISSGADAPDLRRTLATAQDPRARLTGLLSRSANGLPGNLSPALRDVKDHRSSVYRDDCHVDYAALRSPACLYGDRTAEPVVVLFGDSHAAQWFPALDALARHHGWRLVSLTKASCKTADLTTVNRGKPYTACDTWRENALRRIARLRPALVVTSSSEAGTAARPVDDPLRDWTAAYGRVFRRLDDGADRVVVLLDNPWPKGDAVECAARRPLRLRACEHGPRDAVRDPVRREATRLAGRRAGATVLDPAPWLCAGGGAGRCPVVVGDTFVYRDESHVAESYAEALAPVLEAELALHPRPAP
ncbi:acyltransferase family protein [Streptomyces sp. NPDC057794]|uniref:acyltransferase family protein n=1 Tax=Streptomyces sp. NPDC057794 TaxID=3346251 RepID=UPI00369FD416